MKRLIAALGAVCLLATLQVSAQTPDGYAFVGVSVITMDGDAVIADATVVVRGDRIESVGPSKDITVPAGFQRIDGRGKFLMPGLAEMHGHVPDVRGDSEAVEEVLFLYAANGITTVRGMLGWPGQLDLREKALRGEVVSPTLYLAGPSFSGGSISSPEQAAQRVRDQKAEGWDLLKIHPGLTLDEYTAVATTAKLEGIRFGGHVPSDVGIGLAIEMGQETFDHMDGFVESLDGMDKPISRRELKWLIEMVKTAGAWVVPTMVLWESLYGTADPDELAAFDELKYISPAQRASYRNSYLSRLNSPDYDPVGSALVIENRMVVLRDLNDSGARILMGTDAPQLYSVPGFSLHREAKRMVEAGMTPYEVLRTGTVNVGVYFLNSDTFGMVKEGHRADLVLLGRNPLEDLGNLTAREGVMVRGRWLSKEYIDKRLSAIEAKYRD